MGTCLEERVSKLEKKSTNSELAIYIVIFIIFGVAVIGNLFSTLATSNFRLIFADLLEGEPLPVLTTSILNYSFYALIIDIIFTISLILLCVATKVKYFLTLGIIFIIVLFMKAAIIFIGLMLPLNKIIDQLN